MRPERGRHDASASSITSAGLHPSLRRSALDALPAPPDPQWLNLDLFGLICSNCALLNAGARPDKKKKAFSTARPQLFHAGSRFYYYCPFTSLAVCIEGIALSHI